MNRFYFKVYNLFIKIIRFFKKIILFPFKLFKKFKSMYFNYKQKKIYTLRVIEACNIIQKYNSKEYITLYNPTWLGVANSTKGLFNNNVPLEQVFGKRNINIIASTIINNNIKCVIFSQIVDGWLDVIKRIKELNNDIRIKVIWHANNGEVMSDYTWGLNKELLNLYNLGYIESFAFVKKNMTAFYNKIGYKSFYLTNNVKIKKTNRKIIKSNNKIKIGIYNASSREIKNIYTQIMAIKFIPNSIADIVPLYNGAKDYLNLLNMEYEYLDEYISTDELIERIKYNDINIYITFTECSPMFPIESLEAGIPCLVGNNNDYFKGTALEEYLVINREDDALYISNKIQNCIKNKDKIMELYTKWKKDFDKYCIENVERFLK